MSWNKTVRQAHRWLSIVFTVTVIVNIIAVATGQTIEWLYLLPLAPLLLLMPSGLYMFFLSYFGKSEAERPTPGEA
jgi:hypothetical protein